jgi:hypothetical protein
MKINKQKLLQIIKEEISFINSSLPVANNSMPLSMNGPALPPESVDPDGYEGRMAKNNLAKMEEYSKNLQMLIADNENLEPWVQEKIAVAASMIDSVAHYMQYEKKHPKNIGE